MNIFLADIVKVDEYETISVNHVVNEIEILLKKTPVRVLANYITWRVILGSVGLALNERLRKSQLMLNSVMYGTVESSPRLVLYSSF